MQTMFDKLGDLLSEALETGELPKSENANSEAIESTFSDFEFISKQKKEDFPDSKRQDFQQKKSPEIQKPPKRTVVIPQEVKNALSFLGVDESAGYEESKKAYREKLMYYHPDRRNDNPVLQKVAKEKTARLLREWEILEKWYEKN